MLIECTRSSKSLACIHLSIPGRWTVPRIVVFLLSALMLLSVSHADEAGIVKGPRGKRIEEV